MLHLNTNSALKQNLDQESLDILRLIRSENVGPKTFFSLLNYFSTPGEALENLPRLAKNGGKASNIKIASTPDVEKEIESLHNFGANFITYKSRYYPESLKRLPDPPPVLSYIGDISLLDQSIIAIVGARNASGNGLRFTRKISYELGEKGYKIASGLARGIDSSAHNGAIDSGTIAVIAGGIDNIYPHENEKLYKNIMESGLLIAEAPFGAVPKSQNFPQRNRIIAGLSSAVLIMEATKNSGSLITANFALEQNKEVFAVPGFPEDPRYQGTNYLIKQGAWLLENSDSVTEQVRYLTSRGANNMNDNSQSEFEPPKQPYSQYTEQLPRVREELEELITTTPIEINELYNLTEKPFILLHLAILELELAGKLERVSGDKVVKVY